METRGESKRDAAVAGLPLEWGSCAKGIVARVRGICISAWCRLSAGLQSLTRRSSPLRRAALSEQGQGTVEYGVLVGALAVIAMLAITLFKPKLEELWQAIASGIQGL